MTSGGGDDMERACRSRGVFFNAGQKLTETADSNTVTLFCWLYPSSCFPPQNIEKYVVPIQYIVHRDSHEMRGRTPFIRTSAEEFVQPEAIVQRYPYRKIRRPLGRRARSSTT